MKIKLYSRKESLLGEPTILAYRKLGFEVEDNGFFKEGKRQIEVDTEQEGQYQGMSRLNLLRYLREKTGYPIVTSGDIWDILNDR